MAIRGEIFSSQVITDKRTYFFNVKEDRTGCHFLNLVESKKLPNGEFDRHSIMIYEEDVDNFVREFTKAARIIQNAKRFKEPEDREFSDREPRERKFRERERTPRREFREREDRRPRKLVIRARKPRESREREF